MFKLVVLAAILAIAAAKPDLEAFPVTTAVKTGVYPYSAYSGYSAAYPYSGYSGYSAAYPYSGYSAYSGAYPYAYSGAYSAAYPYSAQYSGAYPYGYSGAYPYAKFNYGYGSPYGYY